MNLLYFKISTITTGEWVIFACTHGLVSTLVLLELELASSFELFLHSINKMFKKQTEFLNETNCVAPFGEKLLYSCKFLLF